MNGVHQTSEYKFLKFQTTTTNNIYEQLNYARRSQTTLIIREKNHLERIKAYFSVHTQKKTQMENGTCCNYNYINVGLAARL